MNERPESTPVWLLHRSQARRAARARRRRALLGLGATALVVLVTAAAYTTQSDDGGGSSSAAGASPVPGTTPAPADTTVATATTSVPEPLDPADCTTASWPLERRAALVVFASSDGTEEQLEALIDLGVGGVMVGSDALGIVEDGQLAAALDGAGARPLVSTDEEGGSVQRLQGVIDDLPSAAEMGTMTRSDVQALATRIGAEMLALGFNMDFAPVVDVVPAGGDPSGIIGDRSFGSDPDAVTDLATAFADGLNEAGIMATLKHFPGHGRANADTHEALATTPTLSELRTTDLVPYQQMLVDGGPLTAVMIGHLVVPDLTADQPATLSPDAVTGLLRAPPPAGLGFDGLVVTDDLAAMRAISDDHSVPEATVLALAAGADMALVGLTPPEVVIDAVETAVSNGQLTEAQVTTAADHVLHAQLRSACSG